jgi:hypothetical protein
MIMIGLCAHAGRPRCWPCQLDGCHERPTLHVWWDHDDTYHAEMTGQPKPSGWCGCVFCGEPAVRRALDTPS